MQESSPVRQKKLMNCLLTVLSVKTKSPNFLEVIFKCDKPLEVLPNFMAPHVKLLFADENGQIVFPKMNEDNKIIWEEGTRERIRTYSVRAYNSESQELTILFFVHNGGIGSSWAKRAKEGDKIGLVSIGSKIQFDSNKIFVLLGDATCLPAISYTLEHLPQDQHVIAAIELPNEQDKPLLPADVMNKITWIVTDNTASSQLEFTLLKLPIPDNAQNLHFWGGMESSIAQSLRHFIKDHYGDRIAKIDLVSYWRKGFAEGQFKHSD